MNSFQESPPTHDIDELENLLQEKEYEKLIEKLSELPEVEVADFLSKLDLSEIILIINKFGNSLKSDIFSNFDIDLQFRLTEYFSPRELAHLLTNMSSDDRADLFQNISIEQQDRVLPYLHKAEREDIISLSSYPKETAGSVMNSDFATVTMNMTVDKALQQIRKDAPSKETIYYIYVVDDEKHLIGLLSLKELILADPKENIEKIVNQDIVYATVYDDQETAINKIEKYDLYAIPVVNNDKQLVGIITHDDAIDIIHQEQTEDMEKFMGIFGSHKLKAYLKTPVYVHFQNRAFWVIILAALGLISGAVIKSYESTLTNLILLVLYMPMMASTGGNTGSQASTVIVRALALGEISHKDYWRVLFKELKISLLIATILGLLVYIKIFILTQDRTGIPINLSLPSIAFAVSIAIAIQVITSTLIGAVLPLLASRFKLDPATIASPALTTIVDITGLLIYFSTAKFLLGV